MIFHSLEIGGLLLIEPKVYEDHRGYFFESFNEAVMKQNGIAEVFVQDNQSCSKKNVLRGLHFQTPPFAQGKLVRVIQGAVLDIAVDIRKNSPTFGKHVSVRLDGLGKKMFWIPPGFAHGFLSLEWVEGGGATRLAADGDALRVVSTAQFTVPAKTGERRVCVRAVDVFGFEAEVVQTVAEPA